MKKTGIELIAIERQEQIEKHGYTISRDVESNSSYEQLVQAAKSLIGHPSFGDRPMMWSANSWDRMRHKTYKQRLIIAGALIAAEIDRLQALDQ